MSCTQADRNVEALTSKLVWQNFLRFKVVLSYPGTFLLLPSDTQWYANGVCVNLLHKNPGWIALTQYFSSLFSQVAINFPDSTSRSDKVTIRGSKEDVEKCYKYLAQETENLLANNYRLEVPTSKQYFKLITLKEKVKIQQVNLEKHSQALREKSTRY